MKSSQETQTVFVVDDNPAMRLTLSAFLRAAHLQVETFDSAKAFLQSYSEEKAGCLILDINMPKMSGLELQEHLRSIHATLPIIIMSGQAAVMDAVRAMKMGSFEFVEKPYAPDFLLQRVREALAFERADRSARAQRAALQALFETLSVREKQILPLVISGKPSKAIADELGVAVSTIDNHRANIMKKLKAETSADLTRIVILFDPALAIANKG